MSKINDGGPAFPNPADAAGMSLRDWFAGQALSNAAICTGSAPEYQLIAWFGDRRDITRKEIVSAQAFSAADAMIAAGHKK
ncbi:hypothetical protein [Roseixanthobacter glucoisosaccharinicivorans]|uniref:hypothetical protein n=1 Tax=Roseixanthobacter glucoisosaccharinicivorans TaxID=3119923 RepID=UPI003728F34D